MKYLLIVFFGFFLNSSIAQTWQSIPKSVTGNTTGWLQFIIDPYTNNIWVNVEQQAAVIENDGTIKVFTTASGELGTMWVGSELRFAFTPSHVYCASRGYGFRSFDNYIALLEYTFTEYQGGISSDQDTIFIMEVIVGGNERLVVFTDSQIGLEIKNAGLIISKNGFEYADTGVPCYYNNPPITTTWLWNDPEYLQVQHHEMKFTRMTDTLYISGQLGINKVYNYDVFDTITPNNTSNMPSPNVLEMDWDQMDNLWAVFGDSNDKAFAIARLDGNQWVDLIDANNSPIAFSEFYGLEIDTLGNLWFSDKNGLHTIVTASSPSWLNTIEIGSTDFQVYPNPAKDVLSIRSELNGEMDVVILDTYGRKVQSGMIINGQTELNISNLSSGVYFITLNEGQQMTKFIKQ